MKTESKNSQSFHFIWDDNLLSKWTLHRISCDLQWAHCVEMINHLHDFHCGNETVWNTHTHTSAFRQLFLTFTHYSLWRNSLKPFLHFTPPKASGSWTAWCGCSWKRGSCDQHRLTLDGVSALGITAVPVTALCELLPWGFLLTQSHTWRHKDTCCQINDVYITYNVIACNQEGFWVMCVL